MGPHLHYYTAFTLVDITATGATRTSSDEFERNQQRNWETVIQTIGIGAQPVEISDPTKLNVKTEYMEFGQFFQGEHTVWAFTFAVEHEDVFAYQDDATARLREYFNQVPVIQGLNETARFMLPIFYCDGAIKNIYFKKGVKDLNNI